MTQPENAPDLSQPTLEAQRQEVARTSASPSEDKNLDVLDTGFDIASSLFDAEATWPAITSGLHHAATAGGDILGSVAEGAGDLLGDAVEVVGDALGAIFG